MRRPRKRCSRCRERAARHLSLALLAIGLMVGAAATQASEGSEACFPITLDDVAAFDPPVFESYPATPTKDKPHVVDLSSHPRARRYRTMLRTQAQEGANFAGHYTIAGWGCGIACLEFAIVDASTGKVYFPPQIKTVTADHVGPTPTEPEPTFFALRYRENSRLLIVIGALNDDPSMEGIAYYHWTGKSLKRLRWFKTQKKDWCDEEPSE